MNVEMKVTGSVTVRAERNEIFLCIITEQAARANVMNLKIFLRTAVLATPPVPLQNCSLKLPI